MIKTQKTRFLYLNNNLKTKYTEIQLKKIYRIIFKTEKYFLSYKKINVA